MKRLLLCFLFCFFCFFDGYGQRVYSKRYNYNFTTLSIGSPFRFLTEERNFSTLPISASFSYNIKLYQFISVGMEENFIRIKSSPTDSYTFRNAMFRTNLFGDIWLIAGKGRFYRRPTLIPFLRIGGGFLVHNPQIKTSTRDWERLDERPCGCPKYKTTGGNIFGLLGIRIRIGNGDRIDLEIKGGIHRILASNMTIPMVNKITRQIQKNDLFIDFQVGVGYVVGIKSYRPHPKPKKP